MSTLERIYLNKLYEYLKTNDEAVRYVDCVIRWKDNGKLEKVTIALFDYDEVSVPDYDDDRIFFYVGDKVDFFFLLSEVDIEDMPTEDLDEFEKELNKYAETDEDKQHYFASGEDFDIVNIINLYNTL
jgi:hypothetical protein